MMEALLSSETSVFRRAIRHNIPEYGILRSHRRENLKSYPVTLFWTCLYFPQSLTLTCLPSNRQRPLLPRACLHTQKKSVTVSPQSNCTDRGSPLPAKLVPTRIKGSAQQIPTGVILGFLDRSRYVFFQVAPHLSSRG
jgi:hypothetical protein